MDRSGRIGEERREDKPQAPPPSGEGKRVHPATQDSLLPPGNANPSLGHPPEVPTRSSAA